MFNFYSSCLFVSAITDLPFSIHFRGHKMKNGKMLFYISRNTKESEIYFLKTEHIEMSRTNNFWMFSENAK